MPFEDDKPSSSSVSWHIHAHLMSLAWCMLMPIAVACSILLRHRPQANSQRYPSYFRPHYQLASLAVLLSLMAWWWQSSVKKHKNGSSSHGESDDATMRHQHALVGRCVVCGALVTLLLYNPLLMDVHSTVAREETTASPWYRKMGHLLHKSIGCSVLVTAWFTCWTGLKIVHGYEASDPTFIWWMVILIGCSIFAVGGLIMDKLRFLRGSTSDPQQQDVTDEQSRLMPPL